MNQFISWSFQVYHKDNENCHWSGKHFTFYPNGTVDPCPGHEYFKSKYQYKINYDEIDEFMKLENLNKCKNLGGPDCFCPGNFCANKNSNKKRTS